MRVLRTSHREPTSRTARRPSQQLSSPPRKAPRSRSRRSASSRVFGAQLTQRSTPSWRDCARFLSASPVFVGRTHLSGACISVVCDSGESSTPILLYTPCRRTACASVHVATARASAHLTWRLPKRPRQPFVWVNGWPKRPRGQLGDDSRPIALRLLHPPSPNARPRVLSAVQKELRGVLSFCSSILTLPAPELVPHASAPLHTSNSLHPLIMALAFLKRHITANFQVPDVDLSGRTYVVTGTTVGSLGFEGALHFARKNPARLILTSRSQSKGDTAIEAIRSALPDFVGKLEVWLLDMSSFASVKAFSDRLDGLDRLDGIVSVPFRHIGFGLANLLTVTFVSSGQPECRSVLGKLGSDRRGI